MTVLSDNRSIIVISKDNAFSALMTGYCRSKKRHVICLNTPNDSTLKHYCNLCSLLVLDARWSAETFFNDFQRAIESGEYSSDMSILVIYSQRIPEHSFAYSQAQFVEEFELLPMLDRFLDDSKLNSMTRERRVNERRRCPDRRVSTKLNGKIRGPEANEGDRIEIGDIIVNYRTKTVCKDNRDLALTRKEFELFTLLLSQGAQVYSTESIMKQLWPNTSRANKSDLYQYVHTLRKKLESHPCDPKCLVTVKGVGYQLCL